MCEYCSKTDVTVTKLDDDEESACEWFSEEESLGGFLRRRRIQFSIRNPSNQTGRNL